MESKKRSPTLWIILAILVVVLCCAAIAVALLIGVFSLASGSRGLGPTIDEQTEQSFDAGASPRLTINSFAGNISVRAGDGNTIQVTATKRVRNRADLDQIEVRTTPTDQGLEIVATRGGINLNNASVQFDLLVPAGTNVQIELGAGNITVHDTTAGIDAHTGAGTIDVSGGSGAVRLDAGAGTVSFRGAVRGTYTFRTGAGTINIALPSDARADLNLTTGLGDVRVDFDVAGTATQREVHGTIGGGGQATIEAHTGTGTIQVVRQ